MSTNINPDAVAREFTKALLDARSEIGVAGAAAKYLDGLNTADRESVLNRSVGFLVRMVHEASQSGTIAARAIERAKAAL